MIEKIVEVNESKFGKKKYNQVHSTDAHWVFLKVILAMHLECKSLMQTIKQHYIS